MRAPLIRSLLLATTALSPLVALADPATLPTDGAVGHGAVDISLPGAGHMAVRQGSQAAIVNWGSFSLGAQARVDIQQPGADAMLLNRVTGSTTSRIDGQINANGQVFLVNPNGIMIGPGGQVRAAGFVASTLDIDDDDFVQGRLRFEGTGAPGTVRNHGTVDIVPGGYAALLGGRVSNAGTIRVPMGRVGMGAGERATLDFSGDGFLQVALPSDIDGDEALVSNSGRIEANGGRVEMLAATARDAARNAVNLSGVVEARSVSGRNGAIMLGGGAGGQVQVTGRATTRAAPRAQATVVDRSPIPPKRPTGGSVTVTGAEITLAGAEIDASGPGGGGDIRIGGDFHGGGELPTAQRLGVDGTTRIFANATELGDGGTVVLWSDDITVFRGEIAARGGDLGGDGGFVEVSGKARLSFAGLVDRRAPMGRAGTLLLDPYDVFITGIEPTDGGEFDGGAFAPDDSPANIFVDDLVANLEMGDVEVQTGTAFDGAPGDGTITVLSEIAWTSGAELHFSAVGNVDLQQAIIAPAGGFTVDAGGEITTGVEGAVNVARFTLLAGDWTQVGPDLPDFDAGDFQTASDDATFLRTLDGDGTIGSPWVLGDIYGLQGVGTRLAESYALGSDIDASGTQDWNGLEGFVPIGGRFTEDSFEPFPGSLDGRGFAISDLRIARSGVDAPAGLFAENIGTIENLRLVSPVVIGGTGANEPTGILAGINSANGTIRGITVEDGLVDGDGIAIGGLVGVNTGLIEQATVDADVIGGGVSNARGAVDLGGLAGTNTGTIRQARAEGTIANTGNIAPGISERFEVGGLVGANFGLIEQSRANVDITIGAQPDGTFESTGRAETGGLVGRNHTPGILTDVAATGNVRSISDTDAAVGGLVGTNDGTIERAYATGQVRGAATSAGFTDIGGLVGTNLGTIEQGLATGSVAADAEFVPGDPTAFIGGLVGLDEDGVTNAFWDRETTGQETSSGSPDTDGLTTAELQDLTGFQAIATAAGWDFAANWAPSEPGFYAQLYAIDPVAQVIPDDPFEIIYGVLGTDAVEREVATIGGPGVYVFGPEFGNTDDFETRASFAPPSDLTVGLRDLAVTGLRSVTEDSDTALEYRPVSSFGTFDILPAPLTITAEDQTRVYGDLAELGTTAFTVAGLITDPLYADTVAEVTLDSDGAAPEAQVGAYDIVASDA
ncbi:filamentous hemagglutinin N-terminal domain-containing protein, partial [Rhodobacteraceae bacterium 2376]